MTTYPHKGMIRKHLNSQKIKKKCWQTKLTTPWRQTHTYAWFIVTSHNSLSSFSVTLQNPNHLNTQLKKLADKLISPHHHQNTKNRNLRQSVRRFYGVCVCVRVRVCVCACVCVFIILIVCTWIYTVWMCVGMWVWSKGCAEVSSFVFMCVHVFVFSHIQYTQLWIWFFTLHRSKYVFLLYKKIMNLHAHILCV